MSVDLTLPATSSPAIDPYKDLLDPLLPFALFVHVALGDEEEVTSIEKRCNSQSEGATRGPAGPAPRSRRPAAAGGPDRAPGLGRFQEQYGDGGDGRDADTDDDGDEDGDTAA